MRRVTWVILTSHCVSPNVMLIIKCALYIIFLKILHLSSGQDDLSPHRKHIPASGVMVVQAE